MLNSNLHKDYEIKIYYYSYDVIYDQISCKHVTNSRNSNIAWSFHRTSLKFGLRIYNFNSPLDYLDACTEKNFLFTCRFKKNDSSLINSDNPHIYALVPHPHNFLPYKIMEERPKVNTKFFIFPLFSGDDYLAYFLPNIPRLRQ